MSAYHRLDSCLSTLRLRVLALLFGLLMASVGLSAAFAEGPASEDVAAFRQVIDNQIAAFNRDDADGAYQFASPRIKSIFPTPEIFMAMVKRGYQPVYRAKATTEYYRPAALTRTSLSQWVGKQLRRFGLLKGQTRR